MPRHLKLVAPLLLLSLLIWCSPAPGADKKPGRQKRPGGPPPSKVLVATLQEGRISPQARFTGTIYFKEVSNMAAETNGKVRSVRFDEGRHVKKGSVLVSLNADMLKKELEAKKASRAEVLSEIEKARGDFERASGLFKKKLLSAKDYDQYRFALEGLRNRADSLRAEIDRLAIELSYKNVRAPFDGVVLEKKIQRGEWVNPGTVVATVADDSEVDLIVNVPQSALDFIRRGLVVNVSAGKKTYRAHVFAVVPKGDIRTRTFPVRIRIKNRDRTLREGMEAGVMLPVGKKIKALLVNRDAITSVMGQTAVFAVLKGKAVMTPIKVTGFKGQLAGITGPGLRPGMNIVIKGNERLRPGQPVTIIKDRKRR